MEFSGIGKLISALTEQTGIADTDCLMVGTNDVKKIAWANVIATIKAKLGSAATKSVANNMTTSVAGTHVADAYQIKLLKDQIDEQNTNLEKIGEYYSNVPAEDIELSSGKSTPVASITLPKGGYIITAYVRFAANGSGYRYANISSSSGSTAQHVNSAPTGANSPTVLNLALCINVNNETSTLYLNVFQSSGNNLTCSASGTHLRAIRVS